MRIHRRSRQRETILKILKNTKSHPPADWVYQKARKEIPNISLGTVYRNLGALTEEGLVQRLCLGSSFDRYDADTSFHYHFACQKCGRVYDITANGHGKMMKQVEKKTGFRVQGVKVDFFGFCRRCRR